MKKNKKTIKDLNNEINVLTTLNSGYVNNNIKKEEKKELNEENEELSEDEKLELENLRKQNKELKQNLLDCDFKLKKSEDKLIKLQQQLNEQLEEEKKV